MNRICGINLESPRNKIVKRLKKLIRLYIYSFRVSPIRLLAPHTTSRCFEYSFSLINLPEEKVERILDVGPSFEFFTYLSRKAKSVYGLDPSNRIKNILEKFKKKYPIRNDEISFIQGDITRAPFSDNYFDIITAISTIEHIPGQGDSLAMEEMARILKVGGKIIISVPFKTKSESIFEFRGSFKKKRFAQRYYDLKNLKKRLLQNSNLTLERMAFFGNQLTSLINRIMFFLRGKLYFVLNWIGILCALTAFSEAPPSVVGKKGGDVILILKKI